MSQTDRDSTTDKFLEKKIHGIVATSVAEEGIDIPNCDLVILYNYIGNEISYKQAMGKMVNIVVGFFWGGRGGGVLVNGSARTILMNSPLDIFSNENRTLKIIVN